MIHRDSVDPACILVVAHSADKNHPNVYGMALISGVVMTVRSKPVDMLMEGSTHPDFTSTDVRCKFPDAP
jgi:hypothetical protein